MKYDYAIVIGRFQPFHVGHERVLQFAFQHARRLIVLIGSSYQHRSPKNPFTFEERSRMISKTLDKERVLGEVTYVPIRDMPYNDDAWLTQVREAIKDIVDDDDRVALVGYKKPGDTSSYYQDLFPEWDYLPVSQQYGTFNATDIRNQYFQNAPVISEFLSQEVRAFLRDFVTKPEFRWILDETNFLREYHREWGKGPFVTTDSVVTQSGHILLVTRKHPPYKGALALPGGFLNPKEKLIDGVVRELKEETRINDGKGEIPPKMLMSFIKDSKVFDNPERSARGRIITHAYRFVLPEGKGLYKVRGDDDAEKAQWYSLADLNPEMFMEDHAAIIQEMTGVIL